MKGHNRLADLQQREKELAARLKSLKTELQLEQSLYNTEMQEKKLVSQKLKENLNKTKTDSMIRQKYQVILF